MGFSRQEYWSGLHFLLQGIVPTQGSSPGLPHCRQMLYPLSHLGSPRKGRGTRDHIANIHWITEKAKEFQKNLYFCFIDYAKAFDCVDHNKLWKILKEVEIPDHPTCLLRNMYAG